MEWLWMAILLPVVAVAELLAGYWLRGMTGIRHELDCLRDIADFMQQLAKD